MKGSYSTVWTPHHRSARRGGAGRGRHHTSIREEHPTSRREEGGKGWGLKGGDGFVEFGVYEPGEYGERV